MPSRGESAARSCVKVVAQKLGRHYQACQAVITELYWYQIQLEPSFDPSSGVPSEKDLICSSCF